MRKPDLLDAGIRAYLEAENAYTEATLAPTAALQDNAVQRDEGPSEGRRPPGAAAAWAV